MWDWVREVCQPLDLSPVLAVGNNEYHESYSHPEAMMRVIVKHVASGLGFLHRNLQLIHDDLHPSNVMFDGSCKVIDFGLVSPGRVTSTKVQVPLLHGVGEGELYFQDDYFDAASEQRRTTKSMTEHYCEFMKDLTCPCKVILFMKYSYKHQYDMDRMIKEISTNNEIDQLESSWCGFIKFTQSPTPEGISLTATNATHHPWLATD